MQLPRHVDEILTAISIRRRLLALVTREQRVAEDRELVAGVVEVVLAVYLRALRREQVRDRIAHRDPTTASGVQRTRGVGGNELEIDPLPGERP
jgi:hypothetical protein